MMKQFIKERPNLWWEDIGELSLSSKNQKTLFLSVSINDWRMQNLEFRTF